MQIKLLRILALLGADDQASSEAMYEVLRECLRRADIQTTAAYGEWLLVVIPFFLFFSLTNFYSLTLFSPTLFPLTQTSTAVLYQCVITCTSIYPSSQLVELAARAVGRFLRSDNNNLKYLGITALASIVSVRWFSIWPVSKAVAAAPACVPLTFSYVSFSLGQRDLRRRAQGSGY